MVKIGLNGFGRIGRAVTRIVSREDDLQIVAINELDADIENFVYLLKYDSLYGRFNRPVTCDRERRRLTIDGREAAFHSCRDIREVPWAEHGVDVVIEATGVHANVVASREVASRLAGGKVVVTNAHPAVDATIVVGVNDDAYDPVQHHVVSSSICDANAIAPILHHVHRTWGVEAAHVTTLHPWLSYQNLLDGPVSSISSPGHSWRDYGLGRASAMNLIPKDTTAAAATLAVLPALRDRLEAISFRVPTHIVSASDVTVQLSRNASSGDVNGSFEAFAQERPGVVRVETESLVSSDFIGMSESCIVDARRTRVIGGRLLKMVAWYDNEWGYSSRVVDVARLLARVHAV